MLERKIIGMPPADRLGILRFLVVLAALLEVLSLPFASLAELPADWYHPKGLILLLPQFCLKALLASAPALILFKAVLIAFLILAMIGIWTNFSLLMSALLYFILVGCVHAYASFFNLNVIPLYLLFLMVWLPTGDGFSIDSKIKKIPVYSHSSLTIGWSIFLLRAVLAFCYFQWGYAKLRNMGFEWLEPWNLRHFFIQNNLNPMPLDLNWGLNLVHLPNSFWSTLAAFVFFSELFFPVILFSWNLRQVVPLLVGGLHALVLFLQNLFFPGLVILLLIFYDWDRVFFARSLNPLSPP